MVWLQKVYFITAIIVHVSVAAHGPLVKLPNTKWGDIPCSTNTLIRSTLMFEKSIPSFQMLKYYNNILKVNLIGIVIKNQILTFVYETYILDNKQFCILIFRLTKFRSRIALHPVQYVPCRYPVCNGTKMDSYFVD